MNLSDGVRSCRGRFVLRVFERGRLIEILDEPNLVVTGAAAVQAALVGGNVSNQSVTRIGYGTNGTAPVVGNTMLTGAFTKAVDGATYPVAGTVSFAFSLLTTEANGLAISEFGLLTTGGTLFARKVRAAPLNKTSSIALSGAWLLTF